ncbi:hypothetical protein K439DRAFT_1653076 [Ramaria rubella]|nr:hypothetical protein K439DRAFT_1653076 [Ramaria rubella]
MSDLGNSSSAARLEPFLLMSKSAKGAAAAKLVQDATSAPGVFVFAELLELPNIQELSTSTQHSPFFALLQLFSYKTYVDYSQNKAFYPSLNAAQIAKLKHLSLASFALQKRVLPYAMLQSSLDLPSIRALEDVIIDAIYLDIIRGKLDQKQQEFQVEWVMGRDLAPGALENLLKGLQAWSNTTSSLLAQLDETILSTQSSQTAQTMALEAHTLLQQRVLNEVVQASTKTVLRSRRGDTFGQPVYSLEDRMDVDEPVIPTAPWGDAKKKKCVLYSCFRYRSVIPAFRGGQENIQKGARKRNRF